MLALSVVVLYAFGYPLGALGIAAMSPFLLLFLRFAVSGVLMLGVVLKDAHPGIAAEALDAGLLLNQPADDVIRLVPPLTITDTDDAVTIEATIDGGTSWARDFLAANAAGLIRGLSPGFRVPRGGERIEQRSGGVLRTITGADLFEVSAVTRPAYPEAQVEARNWRATCDHTARAVHALNRWRL